MNDIAKKEIAELVKVALRRKGTDGKPMSQRAFGDTHRISPATINQLLQGKWDLFSQAMWQKLAAAAGYTGRDWNVAETRDYKAITGYLAVAQADGITIGLAHDAGSGKTEAMRQYAANHAEVYFLQCADFWSKRFFLQELYRALGHDPKEMTQVELSMEIIARLRTKGHPLVIIDEVDKLHDTTLMFFIELYNKLDGVCGFFLAGAPYLRIAVENGARRDKRGYREVLSRVGRRFVALQGINERDVRLVCEANGVAEADAVRTIWNEVAQDKDLRRVRREIIKYRNSLKQAA